MRIHLVSEEPDSCLCRADRTTQNALLRQKAIAAASCVVLLCLVAGSSLGKDERVALYE